MSTAKRVQLRIVIALAVVALSAASPALGQTFTYLFNGSAKLTPAGDETSASGSAKLSGQAWFDNGAWTSSAFSGDVSVSGSRLTPYATYVIAMRGGGLGQIDNPNGAADGRGNLTIKSSWWWLSGIYDSLDTLEVYRVDPTGNVLVLSGAISFRYKYARAK